MATAETTEVTPKQFQQAWNQKQKSIEHELKGKCTTYVSKLEKYHIAGQGGMVAPKPPKGKEIDVVALRASLEGGDVKNEEIVRPIAEGGGRISPEEAIRIARGDDPSKPLGVGGLYYAVREDEKEEDEDDEDGEPKSKSTTPKQQPAPPAKPAQSK